MEVPLPDTGATSEVNETKVLLHTNSGLTVEITGRRSNAYVKVASVKQRNHSGSSAVTV